MASIKALVYQYLETHPGTTLYVDDVAKDLKLTRLQVQGVVSAARRDQDDIGKYVEIVVQGNAYAYRPNGHVDTVETDMIIEILINKGDRLLVRDGEGQVYTMIKMEF
jgi:hypothetical protein